MADSPTNPEATTVVPTPTASTEATSDQPFTPGPEVPVGAAQQPAEPKKGFLSKIAGIFGKK